MNSDSARPPSGSSQITRPRSRRSRQRYHSSNGSRKRMCRSKERRRRRGSAARWPLSTASGARLTNTTSTKPNRLPRKAARTRSYSCSNRPQESGTDRRQAPAVVQLQRVAIAHRHTLCPLQLCSRCQTRTVRLHPVAGLQGEVDAVWLPPCGRVLRHETPGMRATPRRLAGGARSLHRNKHAQHDPVPDAPPSLADRPAGRMHSGGMAPKPGILPRSRYVDLACRFSVRRHR